MKKIAAILTSGIFGSASLFAGIYNVDTVHSNVGFNVKHMMVSNVTGKFDRFSGLIDYDETTKTLNALNGKIDVASIDTANEKRDAHLKSADLFDAQQYPEITFTLDKVKGRDAYGKLSMHGVTKPIKLTLENNGIVKDPWGNTRIGLALSGQLNRKDYGITWNTVLEAGGVAVSENVKLDIQLEGILAH